MPVLDAWAILAYLHGEEPAGAKVRDLLEGDNDAHCSWVNLGEVFYILARRQSSTEAGQVVRSLCASLTALDATGKRVLDAASIKAGHTLSYADAFAVAAARELGKPLWTGDPEILSADLEIEVVDLRSIQRCSSRSKTSGSSFKNES